MRVWPQDVPKILRAIEEQNKIGERFVDVCLSFLRFPEEDLNIRRSGSYTREGYGGYAVNCWVNDKGNTSLCTLHLEVEIKGDDVIFPWKKNIKSRPYELKTDYQ